LKRISHEKTGHIYFPFLFNNRKVIIAFIWAKEKDDWWYESNPDTRRFF